MKQLFYITIILSILVAGYYVSSLIFGYYDKKKNGFYQSDFFEEDVIIIPTYMGYLQPPGQLELYVSNDAVTFKNVNQNTLFKSKHGDVWDYSLIFYKGYYYLLFDYTTGIGVAKTKDFIKYEEYDIALPKRYTQTWAPEWFEDDNGDIYIFISLGTGKKENDMDMNNIQYLENYYLKAEDQELKKFKSPKKLHFPTEENRIDPFVIKKDGVYHLFLKNDFNKTIEHFTNNKIGEGLWEFNQKIPFRYRAEALSIIEFKKQYFLYVDAYDNGQTLMKRSMDLLNWEEDIEVGPNVPTRHFTPLVVDNPQQKKELKNNIYNINSQFFKGY